VAFDDPVDRGRPDHVVLEVGTGRAIRPPSSRAWRERSAPSRLSCIAEAAANVLRDLAYDNVSVRLGDGYGAGPNAVLLTPRRDRRGSGSYRPPLIEQLKVGAGSSCRWGRLLHSAAHGRRENRPWQDDNPRHRPVRFVPLRAHKIKEQ